VKPRQKNTGIGPSAVSAADNFAGALHEVSNSLTAVIGWLQEARTSLPLNSEIRDALEIAYRHAKLGYSIARTAIGAPIAESEEVRSALTLGNDALRGVAQLANRKAIHLELGGHDEDALLRDASSAHQILLNLLLNAVSFSPERGIVQLQLKNLGQYVSFVVSDQGPGIAAERVSKLFMQGDSTRPGGSGMGLWYSKQLAQAKGAELNLLDSTFGARFELLWPAGGPPSSVLQKSVRGASLAGLKVAVLEDDEALVSLLEFGLSASGIEILAAKTFDELKQLFAPGKRVDVALVDLSPFNGNPRNVAQLQAVCCNTPIVVMSGRVADRLQGCKVAAWVQKPFELSEVCDTLARVAHRRADK
jgi:hypothetical protein